MTRPAGLKTSTFASFCEYWLWLVALFCIGWVTVVSVQARTVQEAADEIVVKGHTNLVEGKAGQVLGTLDIPALSLSVPVSEGYDSSTLRRGVGHIPGTATPGGLGNFVVAGHRDTFFRALRKIHAGMAADVSSAEGRWKYVVDRTEIVTPDKVEVTEIGDRPEMTLITCYPFDFIGAAPQRFIVHAHLVSVHAE